MMLHTTYFGSVDWYRQLLSTDETVYIDAHENYVKQTSRNRCEIATANGKQILSVPVTIPKPASPRGRNAKGASICDILVSEHGNWRHQHWEALKSAYGMSPFFNYYQDDIRPFFDKETFEKKQWEKLFDYNLAIMRKMLDLIGAKKEVRITEWFVSPSPFEEGWGEAIPYYQTFQRRHGFISGLSILDLLFNEGPEAILYLRNEKN